MSFDYWKKQNLRRIKLLKRCVPKGNEITELFEE